MTLASVFIIQHLNYLLSLTLKYILLYSTVILILTFEMKRLYLLSKSKVSKWLNVAYSWKWNYIIDCIDGYKGLPTFAPFDKIIITCGAPDVPQELINQLKLMVF